MPKVRFHALPTQVVRDYRAGEEDAHGRHPERRVSDGSGLPCRHCLADIEAGEEYPVHPELKIVVYGPDDDQVLDRSLEDGADAFVRKSAPIDDLVVALHQMHQRTIYFRDSLSGAPRATSVGLTPREIEVLQLAASGLTTKAIAESLEVGEQTVKFTSPTCTRS